MTLTPYRQLLSHRPVRSLLLVGVVARIPHTAAGIVLTLHVVQTLGLGYGAAGFVAAASTVGIAVGAPWRGRAIDRLGLRRALIPSVVGEAVVWTAAPFLPYEALLVSSFVGGLLSLPIFTVIRQSLSVLVDERGRRSAYAVDSIGVELSFMVGPAAGVLVATSASTGLALLLVGATTVVAGLGLMWFDPPTRSSQVADRSGHRAAGPPTQRVDLEKASMSSRPGTAAVGWRSPALLAVLGAATGATLVLAGTEVTLVAALRAAGAVDVTGVVFACWGLGSILGALVYGALPRAVHPLWLLLWLAALTAPVGVASSPWLLCVLILPAGALCAPVISATAEAVARLVPEASRGVAMGWHGSALTVGIAMGAPLAGSAIDRVGPWGGSLAVGVVGLVLAGAGLVAQRAWQPSARVDAPPVGSSAPPTPAAPHEPDRSGSHDGAGEPLPGTLAR